MNPHARVIAHLRHMANTARSQASYPQSDPIDRAESLNEARDCDAAADALERISHE